MIKYNLHKSYSCLYFKIINFHKKSCLNLKSSDSSYSTSLLQDWIKKICPSDYVYLALTLPRKFHLNRKLVTSFKSVL